MAIRRLVALVALLAPVLSVARDRSEQLRVSAMVVRSIAVSVTGVSTEAALRVRTPAGAVRSVALPSAASAAGIALAPYAEDPSYLVVTILPDAPLPPDDAPRAER